MTRPRIITVAITGSLPGKKDNPAVPISPEEQVESTHEAFEAGATLVHLHVRDDARMSREKLAASNAALVKTGGRAVPRVRPPPRHRRRGA